MPRRTTLALSFALTCSLSSLTAHAGDPLNKQACIGAYEQSQVLRQNGQLKKAREQLLACSRDGCPVLLQKDCAKWFGEVEAELPTVLVVARDALGAEVLDVRVFVDGTLAVDHLDARAMSIDPGEHTLRFERAGAAAIENVVIVHEGEKSHQIAIQFSAVGQRVEPPLASAPTPDAPAPAPPSAGAPSPWPIYALAGIGVVGLGSFTFFGISGRNQQVNTLDPCKPHCALADIDSVRDKYLAADISLGVAVVALAVGAYLFATRVTPTPANQAAASRATSLRFVSRPRGGELSVALPF